MKNVLFNPIQYGRSGEVLKSIDAWNQSISIKNRNAKYDKMATSAFIFFRGTAHLFWSDFSTTWRLEKFGNAQTRTWIQGDNHIENFGAFHNIKQEVIYGLNDFDEAVVADYQYDLWRMAISIVLVMNQLDENKETRLSEKSKQQIIEKFSSSYLKTLYNLKDKSNKSIAKIYFTKDNTDAMLSKFLKKNEKSNSYKKMLSKWLNTGKKKNKFNFALSKLSYVSDYERESIKAGLVDYDLTLSGDLHYDPRFFEMKDIARRLSSGTGSLGTSRYYILIEAHTSSANDDRILDVKKQGKPTPYQYLTKTEQMDYDIHSDNDAQRHAAAYQALVYEADNFLGWMKLPDGDYSVRERSPFKETFPTEEIVDKDDFLQMAEQWAIILATSHEQASRHLHQSLAKQVGKMTKTSDCYQAFSTQVSTVAFEYAAQVKRDWKGFVKALGLND